MSDNGTFLRQALDVINSTPGHPLSGLVDPSTGKWWAATPFTDAAHQNPAVQAGHVVSKWAGGDQLALQDAFSNQLEGRVVENGRLAYADRGDCVNIGGIPVDRETALMWENYSVLTPGTVSAAPVSPGWARGDKLWYQPTGGGPDPSSDNGSVPNGGASLPGGVGVQAVAGAGETEAVVGAGGALLGLGLAVAGFEAAKGLYDFFTEGPGPVERSGSGDRPRGEGATRGDDGAQRPAASPADGSPQIERGLDPWVSHPKFDAPAQREGDQVAPQYADVRAQLKQAANDAAKESNWASNAKKLKDAASKAAQPGSDVDCVPRAGGRTYAPTTGPAWTGPTTAFNPAPHRVGFPGAPPFNNFSPIAAQPFLPPSFDRSPAQPPPTYVMPSAPNPPQVPQWLFNPPSFPTQTCVWIDPNTLSCNVTR
jgi:hypothetical protein